MSAGVRSDDHGISCRFLRAVLLTCVLSTCPVKCSNRNQRLFSLKLLHPPLHPVQGKVHGKVSDKWIVNSIYLWNYPMRPERGVYVLPSSSSLGDCQKRTRQDRKVFHKVDVQLDEEGLVY